MRLESIIQAHNKQQAEKAVVKMYREKVVKEAIEVCALRASGFTGDACFEGYTRDAETLEYYAFEHAINEYYRDSPDRWLSDHSLLFAEAEALLRCGWRPDWWGKDE